MSTLQPYVFFRANCAEAMRFYQSVIGGDLSVMTQADSPMAAQTPAGSEDLVLHARLQKGDLVLMASDYMANGEYPGKNGFSLSLVCNDVAEAKRIFSALAEGGEVTMEFGKTFWAEAFGMVRDKFGTPWMINGPTQPAPK